MMKVFIALDLYDNMVRVTDTAELAAKWLMTRAEDTWGMQALEHAEWTEVGKDTTDLMSDTQRWPYRVIEQEVLSSSQPIVAKRQFDDTIVLGSD